MTKYLEIGFGNRWFMRTEFEDDDGTEHEVKGWVRPIVPQSIYLRIWIGYRVFIWDSEEGVKRQNKAKRAIKWLVGLRCEELQERNYSSH